MYNPLSADRLRQYTNLFLSKGDALITATGKAYGVLHGAVVKQALVMTYADAFLVIGAFFLICAPHRLTAHSKRLRRINNPFNFTNEFGNPPHSRPN